MADSPLNHSWPSFSKLWNKRWSFKRASESNACSHSCGNPSAQVNVQPHTSSGKGSSPSLSPASITEDVFFGSTSDDQDTSSVVSNHHCPSVEVSSSAEDLQGFISSSLRDSEYFKDLEGGAQVSQTTASTVTSAVPDTKTQQSVCLQEPLNRNNPTPTPLTQTSLATYSPRIIR
ncbi:uncharacterized protein FYW49_006892 [Xenentodon cancila]